MLGEEVHRKKFSAGKTLFDTLTQQLLSMFNNLPLEFPRHLFDMGPAFMLSRGGEGLRIDGYLPLTLLTHKNLAAFHPLMKYVNPMSMARAHPCLQFYCYKCAAGLKTLLMECLSMQNLHLTGEEATTKMKEQVKVVNGGMAFLSDVCLVMRSDHLGLVRGLREVVTCVYGLEVTYAFHDPLSKPTIGSACERDYYSR